MNTLVFTTLSMEPPVSSMPIRSFSSTIRDCSFDIARFDFDSVVIQRLAAGENDEIADDLAAGELRVFFRYVRIG